MAHNIGKTSTGLDAFAFRGDRNDIWHRLGNEYQPGWTMQDWAKHAGLDWTAFKCPAYVDLSILQNNLHGGLKPNGMANVEDRFFICRGDNGYVLSPNAVSKQYQIVQPRDCLDMFAQFVSADDRFQIDTAMCLKGGEIVAVNAIFNGDMTVAGDKHKARLLASTTFDGTGSTIGKGVVTRTVCNNTLDAGLAERGRPILRIRHSTKFDKEEAGKQLALICQEFTQYKAMGDYMATKKFSESDISRFFKLTLDIDPNAKREDISTRKFNQFEELVGAYQVGTRNEGLEPGTAWAAIQGVTRYVDHNKTTKLGGMNETEARFVSAQFGTGATMKQQAVAYLDDMCDGDLMAACFAATPTRAARDDADTMAALLAQPFKPSRG